MPATGTPTRARLFSALANRRRSLQRLHVVFEQVVGHVSAAFQARVDLEPEMDAPPNAAISLLLGERPEAVVVL